MFQPYVTFEACFDGRCGWRAVTLLYPRWIPGEHEPSGPIADVVRLRTRAHGENIHWRRDAKNLYTFMMNVPPS